MDKILELFDPIIKVFNEQFNAIWQMLEKYLSPTINKVAGDLSDKFWFIIPRLFFLFVIVWFLLFPSIRLIWGLLKNLCRYLIEEMTHKCLRIRTSSVDEDGLRHYLVGRMEIRKLKQIKNWNQGTILSSAQKGKHGKSNNSRIQSIHTSRECRDWAYNLKHLLKHWDKIEYIVKVDDYIN